eukprot:310190-Amphidinium_carterae.1
MHSAPDTAWRCIPLTTTATPAQRRHEFNYGSESLKRVIHDMCANDLWLHSRYNYKHVSKCASKWFGKQAGSSEGVCK